MPLVKIPVDYQSTSTSSDFQRCGPVNGYCVNSSKHDAAGVYDYCVRANDTLGETFPYKVRLNDTFDLLDERFGLNQGTLCRLNNVQNCSCLSAEISWVAVPTS